MKTLFVWVFVVIGILLTACEEGNDRLERALELAGENRGELERVLEHYSREEKDSLKLRSARFLIENMPGHYTLEGDLINGYRKRMEEDTAASYYARKVMDISLGHLGFVRERSYPVEDVARVTADFLIRHIDRTFERVEAYPWLQGMPFEVFAEYVLPYRFAHERFDLWIDSLRVDSTVLDEVLDADNLRYTLWNSRSSLDLEDERIEFSDSRLADLYARHMRDECLHIELRNWFSNRAAGLPSVMDLIPHYANRNGFHYWNVAYSLENKNSSVLGALERKAGKIYRMVYSERPHVEPGEGEYVPPFFQCPFYKDVSDEYMRAADVRIPVDAGEGERPRHAYLSVFNNLRWQPIAVGECGREVLFRDMGKNVVYLPVYYENRRMRALCYPFVLDGRGGIRYLAPDTTQRREVRLERKYPFTDVLGRYVRQLEGTVVEGTNEQDFMRSDTLLCGLSLRRVYAEGAVDTCKAYRYWRVSLPSLTACAEVICYDSRGMEVKGKVNADCAWGFDGDPLTNVGYYPSPVIDFGKPTKLSRIVCLPRGDGNGVYPGEEYELFYYALEGWQSLGCKTAKDFYLDFDGLPTGALYWLHHRTKGVEERIFTIEEDGNIRYW